MKKTFLDNQQLALLTQAYIKNLFPLPRTTQCFVEDEAKGCVLYFEGGYHNELSSAIHKHFAHGSFAKSNAENDWLNLMEAIDTAIPSTIAETNGIRSHFLCRD